MKKEILAELNHSKDVLEAFLGDPNAISSIEKAAKLMLGSLANGKKIISCGNGGSMCDAMHLAEELSGRFRKNRRPLAAISISDSSHITCVANDYGFDHVFARSIDAIGNSGDVLFAISTSGNSKNLVLAAKSAKKKKMKTIALTGKDGGLLKKYCHVEIRAPYSTYSDRAQEIHIKVIHTLILLIEKNIKSTSK